MKSTFGLAAITKGSQTAKLLKLVGIEPQVDRDKTTGAVSYWAPAWAVAICEEPGVSERQRVSALRRCARDEETQQWLSPLLGILKENKERVEAIVGVAKDNERTIMCRCGQKFESALKWQDHLDPDDPKCPIVKKEQFDDNLDG